ncbi:ester cyclase [Arthrobacter sedimenti]|uniref:ester cyclase n=1 Tax=Arthrobacter sedimenti TaxID=2694931 RepID=UPI00111DA309|nr:ester cyclase [Arthrobacter sedimenti]
MSTTDENKTVARTFYEAYNGGDLQGAFDTYISQDLVNHTNGGAMNRELWMQSDLAAKVAMPDQTMTILGQAADGDTVFTHWILQGTHTNSEFFGIPASGRATRLEAVAVDIVRNGQIVEHNAVGDFSAFMTQLTGQ